MIVILINFTFIELNTTTRRHGIEKLILEDIHNIKKKKKRNRSYCQFGGNYKLAFINLYWD